MCVNLYLKKNVKLSRYLRTYGDAIISISSSVSWNSGSKSPVELAEQFGRLLLALPTLRNFAPEVVEELFFSGQ